MILLHVIEFVYERRSVLYKGRAASVRWFSGLVAMLVMIVLSVNFSTTNLVIIWPPVRTLFAGYSWLRLFVMLCRFAIVMRHVYCTIYRTNCLSALRYEILRHQMWLSENLRYTMHPVNRWHTTVGWFGVFCNSLEINSKSFLAVYNFSELYSTLSNSLAVWTYSACIWSESVKKMGFIDISVDIPALIVWVHFELAIIG